MGHSPKVSARPAAFDRQAVGHLAFVRRAASRLAQNASDADDLWLRTVPLLAVGVIGDSDCGPVHRPVQKGGSTAECVKGCLRKGARYVFVSGGTVYAIRNQDFADLRVHADHTVQLTES